MTEKITISEIKSAELPAMKEFLYLSIFVPEGYGAPPREVVETDELKVYYEDFGRHRGDICFAATSAGETVGLAWARLMRDYGHVSDDVPSIAVAVKEGYRGRGTGTLLLQALCAAIERNGFPGVSLSVQRENPALSLYLRLGFRTVCERGEEYIMAKFFDAAR